MYMYLVEGIATAVSVSKSQNTNESRLDFYKTIPQQNLPSINSPFFGRAKELNNLKELIISNSVRIININGPPAFGKSRLANQLGHELLQHSDIIPNIRYIDTVTTRKSFYLCSTSTSQTQEEEIRYFGAHAVTETDSPENSRSQNVYDGNLCTWIAWQKQRAVLVFDNCDLILHSEDRKTFLDMLQSFLSMNVQIFNVVVVSQERLFFLDDGFLSFHLGALSPTDSLAMLRHYVQNLTTEQANELQFVVGGCPLALKIVAKLIERNGLASLKSLLANLRQNVTLTLSKIVTKEEDQLHKVIDFAYKNYMDAKSRKCSRILNLFPGSVSEEMANSVLSKILDPFCIEDVIRLSYLEEFYIEEARRFYIHSVIQDYLKSVHLVNSDIRAYNLSFLTFYSHYLTNVMIQSYAHQNLSERDSYMLNDLESHNIYEFVPMLLSTEKDEALILHTAIGLGFLIHEKMIPDIYIDEALLKAYKLYSSSSIFNSFCAHSSEEVCTRVLWESFSYLGIQSECDSHFSYISNLFIAAHPICSQLYDCSKLNPFDYQYTLMQIVNLSKMSLFGSVIFSKCICKLKTGLEWIRSFLLDWNLITCVLLGVLMLIFYIYEVKNFIIGFMFLLILHYYFIFLMHPLTVLYYVYLWLPHMYIKFGYDTCISISDYVEVLQCTLLPVSFNNNTMSHMCNNTTVIFAEEHGTPLVIVSLLISPISSLIIIALLFNKQDKYFRFLISRLLGSYILSIIFLMFSCSVVFRFTISFPLIFYTMYMFVNSVLFCLCFLCGHHKIALISLVKTALKIDVKTNMPYIIIFFFSYYFFIQLHNYTYFVFSAFYY